MHRKRWAKTQSSDLGNMPLMSDPFHPRNDRAAAQRLGSSEERRRRTGVDVTQASLYGALVGTWGEAALRAYREGRAVVKDGGIAGVRTPRLIFGAERRKMQAVDGRSFAPVCRRAQVLHVAFISESFVCPFRCESFESFLSRMPAMS